MPPSDTVMSGGGASLRLSDVPHSCLTPGVYASLKQEWAAARGRRSLGRKKVGDAQNQLWGRSGRAVKLVGIGKGRAERWRLLRNVARLLDWEDLRVVCFSVRPDPVQIGKSFGLFAGHCPSASLAV